MRATPDKPESVARRFKRSGLGGACLVIVACGLMFAGIGALATWFHVERSARLAAVTQALREILPNTYVTTGRRSAMDRFSIWNRERPFDDDTLARTIARFDAMRGELNVSALCVDVQNSDVTDAGLLRLVGHPLLVEIEARGSKVTEEGAALFRRTRPPELPRVYIDVLDAPYRPRLRPRQAESAENADNA